MSWYKFSWSYLLICKGDSLELRKGSAHPPYLYHIYPNLYNLNRKFSGITIYSNIYPAFISHNVIKFIRGNFSERFMWKIMDIDLYPPSFEPPLFSIIFKIFNGFFLRSSRRKSFEPLRNIRFL